MASSSDGGLSRGLVGGDEDDEENPSRCRISVPGDSGPRWTMPVVGDSAAGGTGVDTWQLGRGVEP